MYKLCLTRQRALLGCQIAMDNTRFGCGAFSGWQGSLEQSSTDHTMSIKILNAEWMNIGCTPRVTTASGRDNSSNCSFELLDHILSIFQLRVPQSN